MDPVLIFEIGRRSVSAIGQAGTAAFNAGSVLNGWLKEQMPLEDPSARTGGPADFPPLNVICRSVLPTR